MLTVVGGSALAGCAAEPKLGTERRTIKPTEHPTPAETTPMPDQSPIPQPEPNHEYVYGTAWEKDFSVMPDGPLNPEGWNFVTGTEVPGYNQEEQTYTNRPENVRIEKGALVIQARNEKLDNREFTSARIHTQNHFAFKHGTLEVTAMLPRGVGTWPAAWLMPNAPVYDSQEHGIPQGHRYEFMMNGEIDFLEAIGSIENENIPQAHSFNQRTSGEEIYTPGIINDAYGAFHTYGVIKKPGSVEFTLDGQVFASRTQDSDDPRWWPFEQDYYLILNLAMGGQWAGKEKDYFPPHGIDTSMSDQWQFRIQKISYTPL